MKTFVDTSALYALLDEQDARHQDAARWLRGPGRDPRELLVSHNYVVVEAVALTGRQLGAAAVRALLNGFVPALSVFYVDEHLHATAVSAYLAAGGKPSLVDWASFQMMRDMGIRRAFAFDQDFVAQGFEAVP
ncbi:MAG: PIN domain-containing protein [Actinomycetota bacterium]|nr:PIN domain-containing protein [Actinomycetota bacterium]